MHCATNLALESQNFIALSLLLLKAGSVSVHLDQYTSCKAQYQNNFGFNRNSDWIFSCL